jgi:hypothetical protein
MWQERDLGTHLRVKRNLNWNATSLLAAFIKGSGNLFCGLGTVTLQSEAHLQDQVEMQLA